MSPLYLLTVFLILAANIYVCLPYTRCLFSSYRMSVLFLLAACVILILYLFVSLMLTVCLPFSHCLSSFFSLSVFLLLTVCLPYTRILFFPSLSYLLHARLPVSLILYSTFFLSITYIFCLSLLLYVYVLSVPHSYSVCLP